VRILNEKRPKGFLLENVKNIKSHDGKKTWKIILESLEELDYEVFWDVKDGQDYVPQHRERIFIAGFDRKRYGSEINFSFDLLVKSPKRELKEILDCNVPLKYTLSDRLWQYLQDYAAKHRARGNGFGYGLANIEGISRTLSARYHKDGSEILIPQEKTNPRRLTPRECARLQGFPENFKIPVSDTQAYRQFGNSVVVPLVAAIAKQIFDTIENMEKNGYELQDSVVQ
jgi:DNA (cytosine-5)-methyltransferase 1